MRVLLLGGTAWLGGEVVTTALGRGDEVTCLARGVSGPRAGRRRGRRPPTGRGQGRTTPWRGRSWNVVLDVSRQPGQVRSALDALALRTSSWVFVSSGNAYADHRAAGQDEDAPVLAPLEGDVMQTMETYGEAKVACEQAVLRALGPERALVARVGLIGGPGDVFDRSGYWPLRFARPAADDGAVLVPVAGDLRTSVVDVATWPRGSSTRAAAGSAGR